MSSRGEWEAQAEFMRKHNATHASWGETGNLLSLTLAPAPAERPIGPAAHLLGLQEKMAAGRVRDPKQHQHDVMFAASSVKPIFRPAPPAPSVVPRAVRAKEAAARRGEETG